MIKNFLYSLLNDKPGSVSIRRFIALWFAANISFGFYACIINTNYLAPNWLFKYMLFAIGVLLGLVTIGDIAKIFGKVDVANTIASNDPTPNNAATAKNVVESAKPEDGSNNDKDESDNDDTKNK